jgi:hypothetical protein
MSEESMIECVKEILAEAYAYVDDGDIFSSEGAQWGRIALFRVVALLRERGVEIEIPPRI